MFGGAYGRTPIDRRPERSSCSVPWIGGDGRACVYGFASTDVTDVVIEELDTGRPLTDAEFLPGSADLGLHVFTGCYDDPSTVEATFRDVTEETQVTGP
jgi:hypothetical protein